MTELTEKQLVKLEEKLRALKHELEYLLGTSRDSSRPVGLDQPIGRLSRVDALQQQAMAQANREGHEKRLKQVNGALLAIRSGTYGECRRCEEPIEIARLQVRPESLFCLACQQQIEK